MGVMEFLLLFSRTVSSCWHSAWSNSSVFAYQHLPFLPAESMPTDSYNLCLRSVTALTPSNYRHIVLLSCLFKAFETILNKWFLKHLSSFNLLSDRQYDFRKEHFTGDLLDFLTDSWSSSTSRFGETFDKVWHKFLLSKLPSHGFYPSLCTTLSSLLSGRSISALVDGYCSKPKTYKQFWSEGLSYNPPSSCYSLMIFFPLLKVLYTPLLMTPLCTIPLLLKVAPHRSGLEKNRFFLNQPTGFFWVSLGFFGLFWVLLGFIIFCLFFVFICKSFKKSS